MLINPTAVSPSQYAFTFPISPFFSHIIVFLLPGTTLPEDTLTGVYLQLPSQSQSQSQTPEFKFLGAIGNQKPSAIFKVSLGSQSAAGDGEDTMTDVDAATPAISDPSTQAAANVVLGLSIEPAQNVNAQLETLRISQQNQSSTLVTSTSRQTPGKNAVTTKVLAQRIIKNAFNFLSSFAGSTGPGPGGQEVVPLKSFQDWWTKFERRVENDPGFLEREQD